jgi:hypothetical protein
MSDDAALQAEVERLRRVIDGDRRYIERRVAERDAARAEADALRAAVDRVRALHRPRANAWPRQDACPDCMGGMYADDPDVVRPCGCWGLSTPICVACCDDRQLPSRRVPLQWPCPTARALDDPAASS